MGGLAARAWLRAAGALDRIHHVVTIASPHHGTWLGHFSHLKNGRQMRLASDWLLDLEAEAAADSHSKFTCWYSNCDNVVFPARTATLPGADNRPVPGVAHVELAFHPEVMAHTLARIRSGG
jgi:triacylglycerol esterase/lipase EstA (alpha/beta hydrolase family)